MVRLRDVTELFLDTGLSRDGYSVIGQGKIAEIVSAKSAQRREIFEEAAGIAKFRLRKGEAERRLAAAEENLVRLRDILGELEGRVEPLRLQSQKAKEFLSLSGEKRVLEVSLWSRSLEELAARLREQEDKILICQNDRDAIQSRIDRMDEELAQAAQEMQRTAVEIDQRRGQIRSLEESASHGEAEIAVMEGDIRHSEENIRRIEGEMAQADLSGSQLEEKIAQLSVRKGEQEEALAQADEALAQGAARQEETRLRLEEVRLQAQARPGAGGAAAPQHGPGGAGKRLGRRPDGGRRRPDRPVPGVLPSAGRDPGPDRPGAGNRQGAGIPAGGADHLPPERPGRLRDEAPVPPAPSGCPSPGTAGLRQPGRAAAPAGPAAGRYGEEHGGHGGAASSL